NLPVQYFAKSWVFYHNGGAFVFFAGFRMPCHQIFSRMVFAENDFAADRVTRDMDVNRRHKNTYLNALVFKKFSLFHFFNNHDFSIYVRNHMFFVKGKHSFGVSEKLKN